MNICRSPLSLEMRVIICKSLSSDYVKAVLSSYLKVALEWTFAGLFQVITLKSPSSYYLKISHEWMFTIRRQVITVISGKSNIKNYDFKKIVFIQNSHLYQATFYVWTNISCFGCYTLPHTTWNSTPPCVVRLTTDPLEL